MKIARSHVVIAACVLLSGVARGSVLRVPNSYASIQEAVDQAAIGDTIAVSAGTYAEDVDIQSRRWLTLKGVGKVVIKPSSGIGLTINGGYGVKIQNIRIAGGYAKVDQSTKVTIRGCRFQGSSHGVVVYFSEAVAVTGNRFTGMTGAAIFSNTSNLLTVSGNIIRLSDGADGITLSGHTSSITGNRISGGDRGIAVMESGHLVADNRISGTRFVGVFVSSNFSSVMDNSVRDTVDGIRVINADYSVVNGNDIRKASSHGIELLELGSSLPYGLTVTRNRIQKAADAGIFTEARATRFARNRLKKCGDFGFYVRGDSNRFERNYARTGQGGWDIFNWIGANDNTYIDNDVITSNL